MSTPAVRRQVAGFLTVGIVGTGAYLLLYLLLRHATEAHLANVAARVLVAVPTTWVNARRTFDSDVSRRRIVGGALAVLVVGTVISAVPLAAEQRLLGPDDRPAEVVTLVLANAAATAVRFLLLRNWLFRPVPLPPGGPHPPTADRRQAAAGPRTQPAGT